MHPQPISPAPQLDADDEALLRATLAAHAPDSVDIARGWAALADRLNATNIPGAAHQNGHLGVVEPLDTRAQPAPHRLTRMPRMFTRIAAAVAVAAVLMGTGYGISYYLSIKGAAIQRDNLYAAVNQRQTDQGVTIVVDRAYADAGSTSVLYYIELSPALAARGYTSASPLTFDLTDQYGDEGAAGNIICHPGSGSVLETCEMDNAPFVVPAGVTQLTITFDIYRAVLARGGDHPLHDTLRGAWNFQFTIPFHPKSLGPGGPYVQPTPPAPPAGRVPGVARGM